MPEHDHTPDGGDHRASANREPEWPAALAGPTQYKDAWMEQVNELCDAARGGDFARVLRLLDDTGLGLPVNLWRPGGQSWFTPLHQAAWHGAPSEVVSALVERGAWRNLPDARGRIPLDLARERGHEHLIDVLSPQPAGDHGSLQLLAQLSDNLNALVESRVRTHLPEVRLRPLPVQALVEVPPEQSVWFPVPGMAGGFSISLRGKHLYVTSWSRMVGGSGQAHIVSRNGFLIIDEGFV